VARLGHARISRRTLLKGAGAGAAGLAAIPAAAAVAQAPIARPVAVHVGPPAGTPGTMSLQVTVNATPIEATVEPQWTLAELLRDQMHLTGTKVGCDRGECGSCTVIVDGKAVFACMTLVGQVAGKTVTTVESLAAGTELNHLQQVFWETGAVQCGFCTPGMLMSATALLAAKPKPTADDVRVAISGNLCRCTGYTKIVEAVVKASQG